MTEAAHQMTSNPLPPAKRKPGTVGIGHGVEIRILDEHGREVPQGTIGVKSACAVPTSPRATSTTPRRTKSPSSPSPRTRVSSEPATKAAKTPTATLSS